jgi:aryl-alcohol dehydrogenase-like predicted oxidoreductase
MLADTDMKYRLLGRTGFEVSTVSFGAWAIGGTWGPVDDAQALRALVRAVELGVTFFDTADVYGDGHSERLLGRLRRETRSAFRVATKAGRGRAPHTVANYRRDYLTECVEKSLRNLETDALDLLQLHCPPSPVYDMPEVFGVLDDLVQSGKVRFYGVSVERVDEALKAISYPNVQSVQIVFNLVRQRPAEVFFGEAARRKVGVLARLPLSSGMLGGKIDRNTSFSPDDHRAFNRDGASFDRGETFSGFDFDKSLAFVDRLKELVPDGLSLPQLALRWITMFDEVTCAIPGCRRPEQVEENVRAADLPPLDAKLMGELKALYDREVAPHVHHLW